MSNNAGKTGAPRGIPNFERDDYQAMSNKMRDCITKSCQNNLQTKLKTQNLYFAGPWFDGSAMLMYDTCEKIVESVDIASPYAVYFPKNEINETPIDAFVKNVEHIKQSDVVVAMVDRKDVGTAWEIGMAYALGKKIILLGYDETSFTSHTNVMLAFTGECITLENLYKFLINDTYETVKIKNTWEGIE